MLHFGRKGLPKYVVGFFLFISGSAISALVSTVGRIVPPGEATVIGATLLTLAAAVYFFTQSHSRILSLAETIDARTQCTAQYIEEVYHNSVDYKGIVFQEQERLFREAKEEILVFAVALTGDRLPQYIEHEARTHMFRTLERTIKKHRRSGFRYSRVVQVPPVTPERKDAPITDFLNEVVLTHYHNVFQIKDDERKETSGEASKLTVSIQKISTQRQFGFILIDKRYIILSVDGIVDQHYHYGVGILLLEDRGGKIVNNFLQYFDEVSRAAAPIEPIELKKPVQFSFSTEAA